MPYASADEEAVKAKAVAGRVTAQVNCFRNTNYRIALLSIAVWEEMLAARGHALLKVLDAIGIDQRLRYASGDHIPLRLDRDLKPLYEGRDQHSWLRGLCAYTVYRDRAPREASGYGAAER